MEQKVTNMVLKREVEGGEGQQEIVPKLAGVILT